MDVKYINPILESTINVLSTMAMVTARPERPTIKKTPTVLGDVTGHIDLKGAGVEGYLAISFSKPAILNITEQMLGEQCTDIDETVIDLVGELTNMITGSAKRIYSELGLEFDLTRPTTLVGSDQQLEQPADRMAIVLPFSTNQGNFYVEFCFV